MTLIWRLTTVALVLVGSVSLVAQNRGTTSPLTGAWRVSEVVVTGANANTRNNPEPGFYLFTGQHYSIVTVGTPAPRKVLTPIKDVAKPTEPELRARYDHWNPVTGQTGTYRITGSTVTLRPLAAKNQDVMNGPEIVREFKIDGNTLTWVFRSAAGQPQSTTTTKLTRVE